MSSQPRPLGSAHLPWKRLATVALAFGTLALGCDAVLGLGDYYLRESASGGSGGAGGGATGGGATGGGATGGGGAGGGGAGGSGGGFDQPAADDSVSFGSSGEDFLGGLDVDGQNRIFFAGTHVADIELAQLHVTAAINNLFWASLDPSLDARQSLSLPLTQAATVAGLATGNNFMTTMVGELSSGVDFGTGTLTPAGGTDAYVARFDADGGPDFNGLYGDGQTQLAYAVDNSGGGFVMGGIFQGEIALGGDPLMAAVVDSFIVRFNPSGGHVWSGKLGGASGQDVRALCVSEDITRVYVAGFFDGHASYTDGVGEITELVHDDNGTNHGYVLVLDSSNQGAYVDHLVFSDVAAIVPRDIDCRGADLVVVGTFNGTLDLGGLVTPITVPQDGGPNGFVAKLSTDLQAEWLVRVGGQDYTHARSVAIDDQGDIAVVGNFFGSVDFGAGLRTAIDDDVFVLKLSAEGNHTWSGTYGGAGNDSAHAVAIDNSPGNIIVGGDFTDEIDFGNGVLQSEGSRDLFIAKFRPFP